MQATADASRHFLRNGIVLGLLTALGPFAIDMYLPSLPAIGKSLGADADITLFSLTAYFLTFAIGQLVFGPISDMVGRKPPMYLGIALFLIASVGCALASDIHTLIAFRIAEGLGGATGMVIARAIVRDLHSGSDEVRLLSLLMLVFSVSPVLSPLAGSLVIEQSSWRGVFWLITLMTLIALALYAFYLPETRPRSARGDGDIASLIAALKRLLKDREFMSLTMVGAFAMAGFFVFLANSSFVFTGEYGLTPRLYSLVFSVNAVSLFAGMQISGWLGQRYGLKRVIRWAVGAYAAIMLLLFALVASGVHGLALIVSTLFVGYSFLGLILPISSVMAFEHHGDIAGTASSLMNSLQLVCGSVMMGITGHYTNGTAMPMITGIAACAVLAFALSLVSLQERTSN
jgi:DHA1 family bicyclomycin/chloramphenicol resistance-like MFS transporter